jgi:hypothetical protein
MPHGAIETTGEKDYGDSRFAPRAPFTMGEIMKMLAAVFAGVLLASAVARGQFAPPDSTVAAADPPAPKVEALEKLLAMGDALKLTLEKDAKYDQFLVHASSHLPPSGNLRPNALSYLVGRDKEKAFALVYASESRLPLFYATTGMAVFVSTTKPGQLELTTYSVQAGFGSNQDKNSFMFWCGAHTKPQLNVDMYGCIGGFSASVREAKSQGHHLALRLPHTRVELDFPENAGPRDFPIQEARVYMNDEQGRPLSRPGLAMAFAMNPPPAEFFKLREEDIRKLPIAIKGSDLLDAYQSMEFFTCDLGKDSKILAAARALGTLLPPLPAPLETPEGRSATPPASRP